MEEKWLCRKCRVELEPRNTVFEYLGHTMSHEVLRCPCCGKVLIPGDLAEGRIAELETVLEDK